MAFLKHTENAIVVCCLIETRFTPGIILFPSLSFPPLLSDSVNGRESRSRWIQPAISFARRWGRAVPLGAAAFSACRRGRTPTAATRRGRVGDDTRAQPHWEMRGGEKWRIYLPIDRLTLFLLHDFDGHESTSSHVTFHLPILPSDSIDSVF